MQVTFLQSIKIIKLHSKIINSFFFFLHFSYKRSNLKTFFCKFSVNVNSKNDEELTQLQIDPPLNPNREF